MPNRITPVILNILIINFLVFLFLNLNVSKVEMVTSDWAEYFFLFKSGVIWELPAAFDKFQPLQLISNMFTHLDFMHIFFNMFTLFSLGTAVEAVMGRRDFILLYLFSGIMGSILVTLFDPSPIPVMGASGALFGVLGAFAFYFPDLKLSLFFIPIGFRAKNLVIGTAVISAGLFAYNIFAEHYIGFASGDPRILGGISHIGHLAGLVSGLLFLYRKKILGIFRDR